MPFFPWPVYVAIIMWVGILISTGYKMVVGGLAVITIGVVVYFIKAKVEKQWPFKSDHLT